MPNHDASGVIIIITTPPNDQGDAATTGIISSAVTDHSGKYLLNIPLEGNRVALPRHAVNLKTLHFQKNSSTK